MDEQEPLKVGENTGFIAVDPVSTDWKSGAETGVLEEVRVPSGDWRPYLSPGKWQRFFWPLTIHNITNTASFETDACVSFSAIDNVQAFMNWMIANNKYSKDNVDWLRANGYFNTVGQIDLSPRFTAKMSGTTTNGNSLPNVANSLRHDGCVPSKLWDAPLDELRASFDSGETWTPSDKQWNIYYAAIPPQPINLGQEFARRFDIQYEWITYPAAPLSGAQFISKLAVAPIQIATAVCSPWNTADEIQGCGAGTAHATLLDFVKSDGEYCIRDHYVPFDKLFAPNYVITYGQRIVVGEKVVPVRPSFTHQFYAPLTVGDRGPEVIALQNALKSDGVFPLTVASTGYYGSVTQTSVLAFQRKHQVDTPAVLNQLNGTRVGAKTIAALNKLFDK